MLARQIIRYTDARSELPGHYAGPAGRANRTCRVSIREFDSGRGEAIEIRCFVKLAAIASEVRPSEIIHQDDDEVRFRRRLQDGTRRGNCSSDSGVDKLSSIHRFSPNELQAELGNPGVTGASNLTNEGAVDIQIRRVELSMIEEVEELRAELNAGSFKQASVF